MQSQRLKRMIRLRARRRGMLEVELVLGRAVERLEEMAPQQLEQMARVVEMDDWELWGIITGRIPPPPWLDPALAELLTPTPPPT